MTGELEPPVVVLVLVEEEEEEAETNSHAAAVGSRMRAVRAVRAAAEAEAEAEASPSPYAAADGWYESCTTPASDSSAPTASDGRVADVSRLASTAREGRLIWMMGARKDTRVPIGPTTCARRWICVCHGGPFAEWDTRYFGQHTRAKANGCAGEDEVREQQHPCFGRRRGAGRFVLVPPRIRPN